MAFVSATYGKKKSSLGSLRQKHCQKQLQISLTNEEPEPEPPVSLTNTSCDVVKHVPFKWQNEHSDNIERIASALLDDTERDCKEQNAPAGDQSAAGSLLSDSLSVYDKSGDAADDLRISCTLSSAIRRTTSLREDRPRYSRVGKRPSPKKNGRMLTRASSSRSRVKKSDAQKDIGLVRSFPEGARLSLDPVRYEGIIRRKPICPSLQPASSECSTGTPQVQLTQWASDNATAHDINEKVHAMLAATDALKPSPVQSEKIFGPKISHRGPSRVLARVTNMWDRMQSRHPASESKGRAKIRKFPVQEGSHKLVADAATYQTPGAISPASISAVEIRLNEDNNLNRRKVQKVLGGVEDRIPTSTPRFTSKNELSRDDDPFAEPSRPQTPCDVETPTIANGGYMTPLSQNNPFESELGFENELEDGILTAVPVCSSTPRIRIRRTSTSTVGGCSSEDQNSPTKFHKKSALASFNSNDEVSASVRTPKKSIGIEKGNNIMPTVTASRLPTLQGNLLLGSGSLQRVKKHPSPSKKELENLEADFRRYTRLKNMGGDGDMDELARTHYSSTPFLAPRDKNQALKRQESASKTKQVTPLTAHPVSQSLLLSQRSSRIAHRSQESSQHRAQTRYARPYRPPMARADEKDELL